MPLIVGSKVNGKLPTKISQSPILEAICELRFEPKVPPDAIFGLVYSRIKDSYPQLEKLPLSGIPEEVLAKNKNLLVQPHYRFSNDQYRVMVGPRLISLVTKRPYPGWTAYSKVIRSLVETIESLAIIRKIDRVGLRYVNFFEHDIFDNLNLDILLLEKPVQGEQKYFRTLIRKDSYVNVLQIAEDVDVTSLGTALHGSVLDIDTSLPVTTEVASSQLFEILIQEHKYAKELFFNLLKPAFVKSLEPQYD